jgi:DNA-binding transcriptional MerR regulator
MTESERIYETHHADWVTEIKRLRSHGYAIREAVEWFLEVWETPPPKYDVAYDECEATLLQALADVAKAVGITRSVKHWMDIVSEATEQSTYTTEADRE